MFRLLGLAAVMILAACSSGLGPIYVTAMEPYDVVGLRSDVDTVQDLCVTAGATGNASATCSNEPFSAHYVTVTVHNSRQEPTSGSSSGGTSQSDDPNFGLVQLRHYEATYTPTDGGPELDSKSGDFSAVVPANADTKFSLLLADFSTKASFVGSAVASARYSVLYTLHGFGTPAIKGAVEVVFSDFDNCPAGSSPRASCR